MPRVTPLNGTDFDPYHAPQKNDGSSDFGYGFTDTRSEIAFLWYSELGNLGLCSPHSPTVCNAQSGFGLVNVDPFINLARFEYWTETDVGSGLNAVFWMDAGYQGARTALVVTPALGP